MRTSWKICMCLGLLIGMGKLMAQDYDALLGKSPTKWTIAEWVNGSNLEWTDLQGKVVLVRWWTGPQCPFCRNSSAALAEWHTQFAEQGLLVVALYHHKSDRPLDPSLVAQLARDYSFVFPVGIDADWKTLRQWWLTPFPEADFTSVSFLLDRSGHITHIHPGGEYVKGDDDYAAMLAAIRAAL